jgi:endonuclease-3
MKDSKEYSDKVKKLFKSLKRQHPKQEKKVYAEPVDALVYAVLSEHVTEKEAQDRLARFKANFVDWNDLRVSLEQEILEVLDSNSEEAVTTAAALCNVLAGVFRNTNTVSMEALCKQGKRPARAVLEKITGTSAFVVDYCMLTALDAHAIPLTARMLKYLKDNELVHPESDDQEISGFLTRLISADDGYEFYMLLRLESEVAETAKNKKAARQTSEKKNAPGKAAAGKKRVARKSET